MRSGFGDSRCRAMVVAVGCDHAGFPLKARVLDEVGKAGHTGVDCGTHDATAVGAEVGLAIG